MIARTLVFRRLDDEAWRTDVLVWVAFGFTALSVCLSALLGLLGSKLGRWVAGRTGRRRPTTVAGN